MKKRAVQIILAIIIFAFIWLILYFFISPFIDVQAVSSFLREKPPFSFLSESPREKLLKNFWYPLIALIITLILYKVIESSAEAISERWLTGKPQFIHIPDKHKEWLDFRARTSDLIGQQEQLEQLTAFLNSEDLFQWWWMTGSAGSGKSRIALNWVDELHKEKRILGFKKYDAGFFRGVHDNDIWRDWQPRKPTIIVIDNAAEYAEDILQMFKALVIQSDQFENNLRVLIVERSLPEKIKHLNEESNYIEHRYHSKPTRPSQLNPEQVADLTNSVPSINGRILDQSGINSIFKVSQGNPLIALAAADLILEQGDMDWSTRNELLTHWANRMCIKLRGQGLPESCLGFVALTTFVRGMKWEDASKLGYPNECLSKQTLDRIFRKDTAEKIPHIEPDLFGEIFVINVFSDLNAVERGDFLQSAWGIDPLGAGISLFNMRKDFPDNEIVEILDEMPKNIDAMPFWAGVRVNLIADSDTSLDNVDIHYKEIYELITHHKDNKDINLASSMVMVNAINRYGEAERWDDLQSSLATLHDTAARFPEDSQFVQLLELAHELSDLNRNTGG